MRACVAVLLLAPAASAVYSCKPDQIQWKKYPNTYIACHAQDDGAEGSLEVQKRRCIQLENDCTGITCTGEKCTVRHHHACDVGSAKYGGFLTPQDGEVSYVKSCGCDWPKYPGMYIPCHARGDATLGTLQERQVECLEMGDECIGITCLNGSAADTQMTCSVRHHRACEDGGKLLVKSHESLETSWVKACGDAAPVPGSSVVTPVPASGCDWVVRGDKEITCHVERDRQVGSLDQKKAQCEKLGEECGGVTCNSDGLCTLRSHTGCGGFSMSKFLKDKKGEISYLKSCRGKGACHHPCYYVDEALTDHKCADDCDCTGARFCNTQGQCDATGISSGVCLQGTEDECHFSIKAHYYISCYAEGQTREAKGSLAAKEKECVAMKEKCMGITCDEIADKCTIRHPEQCDDGTEIGQWSPTETSYTKACGKNFPASSSGQGSSLGEKALQAYLFYVIILLVLLVGVLSGMVWRNRRIASQYGGGFATVPQVMDDEDEVDMEDAA
eukprot:TRINITY_DN1103_c2_g5_i1.p1 TRINITY_DN1103_c2_g5~~TRINITY_DN1103_c2_g5_i1.p1  ORF type:complete len:501 (+),score=109.37 TRINITY_DN1103_c2_g5_i1:109-1611(+)